MTWLPWYAADTCWTMRLVYGPAAPPGLSVHSCVRAHVGLRHMCVHICACGSETHLCICSHVALKYTCVYMHSHRVRETQSFRKPLLTAPDPHRSRGLRTPANMFIINLAVSDFLMSFTQAPVFFASSLYKRWLFGETGAHLGLCCTGGRREVLIREYSCWWEGGVQRRRTLPPRKSPPEHSDRGCACRL